MPGLLVMLGLGGCGIGLDTDRTRGEGAAYVYGVGQGSQSIVEMKLDENSGALTYLGSVATGLSPGVIAVDPSQRTLVLGNGGADCSIWTFNIDPSTGLLTHQSTVSVFAPSSDNPYSIQFSPQSAFAYVVSIAGNHVGVQFNRESNVLDFVNPAVALGSNGGAVIHPQGLALYTSAGGSGVKAASISGKSANPVSTLDVNTSTSLAMWSRVGVLFSLQFGSPASFVRAISISTANATSASVGAAINYPTDTEFIHVFENGPYLLSIDGSGPVRSLRSFTLGAPPNYAGTQLSSVSVSYPAMGSPDFLVDQTTGFIFTSEVITHQVQVFRISDSGSLSNVPGYPRVFPNLSVPRIFAIARPRLP